MSIYHPPKISIVIPIYKEREIGELLKHLTTLDLWEECEVLVVSADEESHFERHKKQLHSVELSRFQDKIQLLPSSKGRGVQMNRGAEGAKGKYLLFLHADSCLETKSLMYMVQSLENNFVAGGFSLYIDGKGWKYRFVSVMTNWRARRTSVPYGDQGIFVYRGIFESVGGYREIPIMEDVDFIERLKKKGHKAQILPNIIKTSPRRWEKNGFWKQTIKNRLLSLAYLLGVSPQRLARYY